MTALKDRFWAKVLFSQFIKHYRKMNDEQIVADIKQSMDDLEDLIDEGDSFGAKMVRWSMERAEEPSAIASRENGKKGGRPRKKKETTADGDIREDSQADQNGSAIIRNETRAHDALEPSANHYGVAPHREAGDVSATDSNNSEAPQIRRTGAPVRGATSSTAPVRSYRPRKVPHPKGEYEVFDFAGENGIPEWVANEFYQRFFVERDGTDNDGNNIDNWKGALINYNKSRKREPA